MIRPTLCTFASAAVLVLVVSQAGCGKGTPKALTAADFAGTWIEIPTDPAARSNRVIQVARLSPKMRKVTLNADGAFKLELADPSGTVAEAGKSLSGNWKLEADVITCENVKNTLGKKFDEWLLLSAGTITSEGGETRATLGHANGEVVTYKKL